jgi:hypothetical protein
VVLELMDGLVKFKLKYTSIGLSNIPQHVSGVWSRLCVL